MMARSMTWPRPVRVAGGQGEVDRVRGRQRGDRVGQPERRQRRRAVGLAGGGGEAAHRLGERAEAGPAGVRAELAEPADPGQDQAAGWRAAARPGRGPSVPACRAGSSRSARRRRPAAGAARRAPSGADRLSVTSRLLRPSTFHHRPTPSLPGPWPRDGSGWRGCSTLITSAPKSPRNGAGERPGEQRREFDDLDPVQRLRRADRRAAVRHDQRPRSDHAAASARSAPAAWPGPRRTPVAQVSQSCPPPRMRR